ncbi:hypothetical protein SGGMMB4_02769 [Sodalis glossinidius str. 'morsitans']|uniref:Hypothetical phage protein n=1 Tax=Sodalis glossinidius (strain morsitans) TaxID=343509 RepID=Q2NTM5_SODGM|nr:hypothetical protein [Sodalis glossinidius]BAE74500.1 hypothetical phage protein [Sodalis glossinidius str. 'morsitans']CRL45207.1 hypothetical protein SGGMMB4_02769 [Sodalis glossinidius str. 'morsitans']
MGQIAFDTLQASEELQTAGLTSEQAKAISLVVRKSHEVADVATKRDLEDVRKDLTAQIADVRKDLSAEIQIRFDKSDAQINLLRKDTIALFEKVDAKSDAQISLLRKDVENIATGLLLKLGGVIVVTISAATAVMKFL